MQKSYALSVLVLVTLCCSLSGAKLPSDFQVCKRDDSNLSSCMKAAVQTTLSKLDKGIPELHAPSIEPLIIPSVTIGEGKGAVTAVQRYKNFEVHHLSQTRVESVGATFTDQGFRLDLNVSSPDYRIDADYEFDGRILLVPVTGSGRCNATFQNITGYVHLAGKTIGKKGKSFLTVEECDINIDPGKVVFYFDNLFNGDERLSRELHKLLNENWRSVFEDVKASYEEVLENVFRSYIGNIFSKVPYDELMPKSNS